MIRTDLDPSRVLMHIPSQQDGSQREIEPFFRVRHALSRHKPICKSVPYLIRNHPNQEREREVKTYLLKVYLCPPRVDLTKVLLPLKRRRQPIAHRLCPLVQPRPL